MVSGESWAVRMVAGTEAAGVAVGGEAWAVRIAARGAGAAAVRGES